MNSYEMLLMLRDNLGETVEKHWTDLMLLKRLNAAKDEVVTRVLNSPGDWLLKKSAAITPVNNQLTLPSDCVFPVYVEEVSSGLTIPIRGTIRERRGGRCIGTSLSLGTEAYLIGNYIEINQESFSNPCYLWYQPRIIDLHAGLCAATVTDATHIGFELGHYPSGADDYYNGVTVEVRDSSSFVLNVSTPITDYVGSTGVATIASSVVTAVAGDFYGTVCGLPQELHEWIVVKATVRAYAKPSSTFEKEIFGFWRAELKSLEEEMEDFLSSRVSGSTYVREAETN